MTTTKDLWCHRGNVSAAIWDLHSNRKVRACFAANYWHIFVRRSDTTHGEFTCTNVSMLLNLNERVFPKLSVQKVYVVSRCSYVRNYALFLLSVSLFWTSNKLRCFNPINAKIECSPKCYYSQLQMCTLQHWLSMAATTYRSMKVCRYYNGICLESRDFLPVTNRTPWRRHWRVIAHWEALYRRTYVKRRGARFRSCLNAESWPTLLETTCKWALLYLNIEWCPTTSDQIKLWYFYADSGTTG